MFRELLNRLIDERLEEGAADKAHITVSPEEVDNGIRQVASQTKLQPKDVINEAKRQGLTEQDYRDEIRRQVLEGKLIQLRVRGRVRVTEQDARAAYARWLKEVQQQHPVDLKIIVLQIPPGSTAQTAAAIETLGQELSIRARRGDDFCDLVSSYSQDPTTKNTCGSRGPVPMSMLFPELQQAASSLKPGETATPIQFRDPMGNSAVLVVQLASQQPQDPALRPGEGPDDGALLRRRDGAAAQAVAQRAPPRHLHRRPPVVARRAGPRVGEGEVEVSTVRHPRRSREMPRVSAWTVD